MTNTTALRAQLDAQALFFGNFDLADGAAFLRRVAADAKRAGGEYHATYAATLAGLL